MAVFAGPLARAAHFNARVGLLTLGWRARQVSNCTESYGDHLGAANFLCCFLTAFVVFIGITLIGVDLVHMLIDTGFWQSR
eukprot:scaffold2262_cov262-Pinguiococcus_pyrenoidosus.AAC.13